MLSLYHKNIDWRQKCRPFAEFYRSHLPCYKTLEIELDLWEAYWLNDTSSHSDILLTLKSIDFKSFSNIKVCLRILGTLPVTTRVFLWAIIFPHEEVENLHLQYNDIRKIEWNSTYACSSGIVPDIEKVIDLFTVTNRRLNLIWFLLVFNHYIVFALKVISEQKSKKVQGIFGKTFILAWLSSAVFLLQNRVSDFFWIVLFGR